MAPPRMDSSKEGREVSLGILKPGRNIPRSLVGKNTEVQETLRRTSFFDSSAWLRGGLGMRILGGKKSDPGDETDLVCHVGGGLVGGG